MGKQFCPHCLEDRLVQTTREEKLLRVRDLDIPVSIESFVCDTCGKTFAAEEQEEENLHRAYEEYRRRKCLLSPTEIVEIRRTYGLSQPAFSRWLGWGDITVHRYESGAPQDSSHNETLMLLKDPRNARAIFEKTRANLDEEAAERLAKTLDRLLSEKRAALFESDLEMTLQASPPSEFNGNRRFDMARFENLVLYILGKVGPMFKTALIKYLWYIDFGYYRQQTVSITGAEYLTYPYGPVPRSYDPLFGHFADKGLIDVKEVIGVSKDDKEYVGEIFVSLNKANMDLFQGSELKAIDAWIAILKGKTAEKLSQLTHKEEGYIKTPYRQSISYRYAEKLKLYPDK
jgi:putative zinc finger/helix-turn-helix YgiT family protein